MASFQIDLKGLQAEIIAACAPEVQKYSDLLNSMVTSAAGAHPINFSMSSGGPSYDIGSAFVSSNFGVMNSNVNVKVEFTINPDVRPSWYKGSADLVYLFNNGYDTNGKMVFKDGHGSLTHRSGSLFVNNAVDAFNAATPGGVTASHDGSFYKNA